MEHEVTERGFRAYRFDGEGCRSWDVQVVESSIAFEGAHVRIYHGPDEHVQLHVDVAEKVAHAMLDFVRAARAGELTEPVYVEDGDHGHEAREGSDALGTVTGLRFVEQWIRDRRRARRRAALAGLIPDLERAGLHESADRIRALRTTEEG